MCAKQKCFITSRPSVIPTTPHPTKDMHECVPLRQHYLPPTVLAANTTGRQHYWPPTVLAANSTGRQQYWPPALLAANTTGRQHYWPQTLPAVISTEISTIWSFFRKFPQLVHNLIESHRPGSRLHKPTVSWCVSILGACLCSIFRVAELFGLICLNFSCSYFSDCSYFAKWRFKTGRRHRQP